MSTGLHLSIKELLDTSINKYGSYYAIYNSGTINEKNIDLLFNGLISKQAIELATRHMSNILERSEMEACVRLEDSELFSRYCDYDSGEEPLISEDIEIDIVNGQLSSEECLQLINSLPETDDSEELRKFFTIDSPEYLRPIVLSFLTSLILFQMQINDENQETSFTWLPTSSDRPDLTHATLYGKNVNLKEAIKHGFGINYGCNCGSHFKAMDDKNIKLLSYLRSIAEADINSDDAVEVSNKTYVEERRQTVKEKTGIFNKIFSFLRA